MSTVERFKQALEEGTSAATHGNSSTYDTYGCRCDECTLAHKNRMMATRLRRAARLKADPTLVKHGLRSTYVNWFCRCGPCTKVHSEACAEYDKRRKESSKK